MGILLSVYLLKWDGSELGISDCVEIDSEVSYWESFCLNCVVGLVSGNLLCFSNVVDG